MSRVRLAVISALVLAAGVLLLHSINGPQSSPGRSSRAPSTSHQPTDNAFDFFVLALSWSPSFCETRGDRADRRQCGEVPYAFIVHGLWPQFERGYPEFCGTSNTTRVAQRQMNEIFDLMPSSGLVIHQWRKHGTCTGMSQAAYFQLVRAAWGKVVIPTEFRSLASDRSVDPDVVEAAFLRDNPQLDRTGIAVTCDNRYLRDVRICMTRELSFRSCEEVDRNRCGRRQTRMPATRARR